MFEGWNVFSWFRAIKRTSIHGHAIRTSGIKIENVHMWVNIHPGGLFDMRISIFVIFSIFMYFTRPKSLLHIKTMLGMCSGTPN